MRAGIVIEVTPEDRRALIGSSEIVTACKSTRRAPALSWRPPTAAAHWRSCGDLGCPSSTRTILMTGYGGSITLHAMSVAALKHVEILCWWPRSETTLFAPMIDASRAALSLRLRQFEAVVDPRKTVAIASKIVAAKLKAEGHGPSDRKAFV